MWYKKHSHLIKHTWCMNSCSVSYFDSTAYHVTFLHVRDESRSISRILFQVYPDTIYRMISKRYGMKIHCMRRYDVCWLWSRWKLEKKASGYNVTAGSPSGVFHCVCGGLHAHQFDARGRAGRKLQKQNERAISRYMIEGTRRFDKGSDCHVTPRICVTKASKLDKVVHRKYA